MALKFLQQNILKGRYLDEIISFVKDRDLDIINFQEVAGGELSYWKTDDFENLKKDLNYKGVLVKTINPISKPDTYFGVATFFKKNLTILESKTIWLKKFDQNLQFKPGNKPNPGIYNIPRAALVILLEENGRKFYLINTHLNRGSDSGDTKYKLEQAQVLIDYIKTLEYPFVLTGDFNVNPDTQVIKDFNRLAENLTVKNRIKYTLNPKIHYLKDDHLKLEQLAVDFIFVSKSINVKNFQLVTEDLSDHYGLFLEFEV